MNPVSCREHADQITVPVVSNELRYLVFIERCDSLLNCMRHRPPDVGNDRDGTGSRGEQGAVLAPLYQGFQRGTGVARPSRSAHNFRRRRMPDMVGGLQRPRAAPRGGALLRFVFVRCSRDTRAGVLRRPQRRRSQARPGRCRYRSVSRTSTCSRGLLVLAVPPAGGENVAHGTSGETT